MHHSHGHGVMHVPLREVRVSMGACCCASRTVGVGVGDTSSLGPSVHPTSAFLDATARDEQDKENRKKSGATAAGGGFVKVEPRMKSVASRTPTPSPLASRNEAADSSRAPAAVFVALQLDGAPLQPQRPSPFSGTEAVSEPMSPLSCDVMTGDGLGLVCTQAGTGPRPVSRKQRRMLSERRASGSQLHSTPPPRSTNCSPMQQHIHLQQPQQLQQVAPGGVRRLSRPSTPISRTERGTLHAAQSPRLAGLSLSVATAVGRPYSPLILVPPPDPLGWAVAPNSATAAAAAALELSSLSIVNPIASSSSSSLQHISFSASRRRTTSTAIPETIQERLNGQPAPAQPPPPSSQQQQLQLQPHSPLPGQNNSNNGKLVRRATGGTLSPVSSSSLPLSSSRISHVVVTVAELSAELGATGTARGGSSAFCSNKNKQGGNSSNSARFELTDAQECELEEKPCLWTDPAIYTDHCGAMFDFYASLPVTPLPPPVPSSSSSSAAFASNGSAYGIRIPSSPGPGTPREGGGGGGGTGPGTPPPVSSSSPPSRTHSTASLPSIHAKQRIAWPGQVQRLARDCIQRLFLLVRREVRRNHPELAAMADTGAGGGVVNNFPTSAAPSPSSASSPSSDGVGGVCDAAAAALDKKTWSVLEGLLPGHGHEGQTLHYVSLYLLSSLAKSVAGSVGLREFALLFPQAQRALFSAPGAPEALPLRERRRVIQSCYALKIDDLLRPIPLTLLTASVGGTGASGSTGPSSPLGMAGTIIHTTSPPSCAASGCSSPALGAATTGTTSSWSSAASSPGGMLSQWPALPGINTRTGVGQLHGGGGGWDSNSNTAGHGGGGGRPLRDRASRRKTGSAPVPALSMPSSLFTSGVSDTAHMHQLVRGSGGQIAGSLAQSRNTSFSAVNVSNILNHVGVVEEHDDMIE